MSYIERFRHFWELAQPWHKIAGRNWYPHARGFCEAIADGVYADEEPPF